MPASKSGPVVSLVPTQVKWEEVGAKVEGDLVHKEMTTYRDQLRGRYLIRAEDGLKVVLGTFQIDQAMVMVEVGEYFGIEYLGEEGTNAGNKFKLFNIWKGAVDGLLDEEEASKVTGTSSRSHNVNPEKPEKV